MGARLELEVEPVASAREALRGADVVVTSGPILKEPQPAIEAGWLEEGAFAAALDFDSYWQPGALREMDVLVTDDLGQFRFYRESGYFQHTPEPHGELADVVAGARPGRADAAQRTFAMTLGLALADMATAAPLYRAALERGIGRTLPL
jgi:ornithine cyclodeaminase/alanine dehydrogenase-like protein (mu-crystallin family)